MGHADASAAAAAQLLMQIRRVFKAQRNSYTVFNTRSLLSVLAVLVRAIPYTQCRCISCKEFQFSIASSFSA